MLRNKDMAIYLSLICVTFLWGTSFAASKIALHELSPLNLAGFRFIAAAIIFGSILAVKKSRIYQEDIPQLVVMGFLSITSYFYIQYTGLLYTTSINASLLLATSPVWTTIVSIFIGQEKINRNAIGGILLAFLGVTIVISRGKLFSLFMSETILGDMLMLLNAIVWAIFTLYGKKIMSKYSPFTAVAYMNIFGTLMLLPIILIPNPLNPTSAIEQLSSITLPTIAAVVYLATLCSVYAYYTWYKGIARIGAVRTASFQYVSPLFAFLAGILLLSETISPFMMIGGIMVIFGVYLTNKQKANLTCTKGS
ncbi:drug/metabolite transporter (DMT)-like permease [Sporomusaceae bacterium BoRhaA]|uniref:DMT family transporter n=1 Tax=Pelorhabdus rhamnosifermentans TaxID=2772457 RepID=UPI001C062D56|nr:DMT family transporter [Pelorhabdus rhamnosifermentans]MBU2703700.1 drug/metabolite transporter (DMT)-like permease [Pelorhabdus rhamnosifermentans]